LIAPDVIEQKQDNIAAKK